MPAEGSIAESAKQRSLRVPLDHFRRADALVRVKLWLSAAAAALACGYVAWLLFGGRAGAGHASPGPVAGVHAAWNDDCQSCHVSFRPLSSGAVDLPSLAGFGPGAGTAAHRELLDWACEKCHAAAAHQRNMLVDEIGSCASCHREHRGAAADIVRPGDSACTRCHADIAAHRSVASRPDNPVENVTRFAAGSAGGYAAHPAFRSLGGPDPGHLKFNHWLHLQPGIAPADARQKQRIEAGRLVQLDCGDCHQPEASGASMQTINFERHCRQCHPLELKSARENAPPLAVKHGLAPRELAAALDGLLWDEQRRGLPLTEPALDESGAAPLIPGKTLGANLAQKLASDLLVRRQKAELAIAARCQQCHYAAAGAPQAGLTELVATNVKGRWLDYARFDHAAHRHVANCRECHEEAYEFEQRGRPQAIALNDSTLPPGATAATDDQRVMIAGLETCLKCHAPAKAGAIAARHDCAECHMYHHAHSFPASPLETRVPDAHSSNATPRLMPVALQAPQAASLPPLARLAACATSGCHGDAQPGAPAWRSSFATWLARDPHVQAADVLWTHRARQMTRLLAPGADHDQVLQTRCLNCHASDRQATAAGVHCDSCHGDSAAWLHTHYRGHPAGGSIDLAQRAKTCTPCHVGPAGAGENAQAVDHDLIAAGHPRQNFEFRAYFESLPAHWNRARDEARLPGEFHFQSWLAAQAEHSAQLDILRDYFRQRAAGPPGDFALLDCAACHHALEPGQAGRGEPRPPLWPRGDLRIDAGANSPGMLVKRLLEEVAGPGRGFDDAVGAYLAARALAADFSNEPGAQQLRASLAELGRFLARDCFGPASSRLPGPYDSPQRLDREALSRHVQAVAAALDDMNSR